MKAALKSIAVLACIALLLGAAGAEAARRVITFTNNTGQAVDDLHIVANQGCSVDFSNTSPFDSERGSDGKNTHNLYNGTVPNGGTATVTLKSDSETITLKEWWWTRGGNALKDGAFVDNGDGDGKPETDDGSGSLVMSDGTANGDGALLCSIGGQQQIFQTVRGDSPEMTLWRIRSFFDVFVFTDPFGDHVPLISYYQTTNRTLSYCGNILGSPHGSLRMQILQQDSGQPFFLNKSGLLFDAPQFIDFSGFSIAPYNPGPVVGQNGWEEWIGSQDVSGEITTEFAYDDTQSLKIVGEPGGRYGLGDDTVRRCNISGGQWQFRMMTYVPVDSAGRAYVVLLNQYPENMNWSATVILNSDTDKVQDWSGATLPLIQDEWVELLFNIDLDNDRYSVYYGGQLLVSDLSWKDAISGGGTATIAALDLYGGEPGQGGTTGTYFDDIQLNCNTLYVDDFVSTRATTCQLNLDFSGHLVPDSDWGQVTLEYNGYQQDMYFNLAVNGVWEIQNVPFSSRLGPGVTQETTFHFDLGVEPGTDIQQLLYAYDVTAGPLLRLPGDWKTEPLANSNYNIYGGFKLGGPPVGRAQGAGKKEAKPEGPMVKHGDDFPNQEADMNECVPTAVSNSLKYLKKHFGLTDAQMPDKYTEVEDTPGDKQNTGTKPMTGWGPSGCEFNWWKQKDKYMKLLGLPIETKKVNMTDPAAIMQALKDGADIELNIKYPSGGGHCVAVVGIQKMSDGNYQLEIVHDTDQKDPKGGTKKETVTYDPRNGKIWGAPWIPAGSKVDSFVVETVKKK